MTLEHLLKVIEFLVPIANTIPVLGSPVEGSLEAVKQIVLLAQDVKSNKQDARELAQEATRWIQTIVLELSHADKDTLQAAELGVNELHQTLKNILSTSLKHLSRTSTVKAVLKATANAEEIRRLRTQLDETFRRFTTASHLRVEIVLKELIAANDRGLLEKKLGPIHLARYDARGSPRGCLVNTREDILLKLQSWAEEECPGLSIFWLTGLAGTGKSTIAKSFCEWLASRHQLLLTFFASRQDAKRRDPLNIVHTFAYELSRTTDQAVVHRQILTAVKSPPEITARELDEQVDRLVSQPLALALATDPFPFFVLDALDECDKIDGVEGGSLIPRLVSQLSDYPVKILVTSRQENSLLQMFQELRPHSIRLQDTEDSAVEADVARYFEDKFAHLRPRRPELPEKWPLPRDVEILVKRTGHLFVFASAVMKFISHPRYSPQTRLQQLLDRHAAPSSPFSDLDVVYAQILATAVGADGSSRVIDEDLCIRMRVLLGTIVHIRQPMPLESLALLLGVPIDVVDMDVKALSALLLMPTVDDPNTTQPDGNPTRRSAHGRVHHKGKAFRARLRVYDGTAAPAPSAAVVQIFHPSFPEFLGDQARAGCYLDARFLAIPEKCHEHLAICCMKLMNLRLKLDSCDVRDLLVRDLLRSDFGTSSNMSAALRYVCAEWTFHLTRIGTCPSSILLDEVEQFIRSHLLRQWTIALCMLRRDSLAMNHWQAYGGLLGSDGIRQLLEWCRTVDNPRAVEVIELRLQDALHIALLIEKALEVVHRETKDTHWMRSDEYRVCSRELDTYVACWTEQALVLMDCCTADKRFVLSRVGLLHQALDQAASLEFIYEDTMIRRMVAYTSKGKTPYHERRRREQDERERQAHAENMRRLRGLQTMVAPLMSISRDRGVLIDSCKNYEGATSWKKNLLLSWFGLCIFAAMCAWLV